MQKERGQTNNAMVTSFKMMKFDENLPIINKNKSPNKGGEENTRRKDPSPDNQKNPPKRVDHKRN